MTVAAGAQSVLQQIDAAVATVAAFRATVTAVNGSLISIQRIGESAGGTAQYASCTRFVVNVGDVVLCIPLGEQPVVIGVISAAPAATPTYTALAAAGNTAVTTGSAGNDRDGTLIVIPGGTGIVAGSIADLVFAVAKPNTNYRLIMTPASTAARALATQPGLTTKATNKVTIATATALTTGLTYAWGYNIEQY